MVAPLIPVKTPAGQAELASRERRVSQRHRTLLLLIDGKRSENQVRLLAQQAGCPDSCFDELLMLGLILLPNSTLGFATSGISDPGALPIDIALDTQLGAQTLGGLPPAPSGAVSDDGPESELPPSRTLVPESVLGDSVLGNPPDSQAMAFDDYTDDPVAAADPSLEEAREILIRALRAEAPLTGSLTLMRLRRAHTRGELAELIDEVESRIVKPYRSLSATQTLRRARQLLAAQPGLPSTGAG